jgi:membrane fusion protein, multidrug efflux system
LAKYVTRLLMLLVACAAVGAVYIASTKEQTAKTNPGGRRGGGGGFNAADIPVPVTGTEAKRADVPLFLDGVGTARALNTVTVKPQADGKMIKLHFREGQTVEKGALLAEIDPTPYKAALDQVVARRAVTETQLLNAKRDSDRYARIPGVVAQKTVDNQAAQVAQFEAQIKADDAAIASARATLEYTRVTAPITGRTGLRMVDEGNIVRAGDAGLVTITQVQPISVLFNIPQQQLQRVNRAQALSAVSVEALDPDGKTIVDKGSLQVVDNQVDQTTGTVRMKADFPNATMQLWPGQFVNVRLLVETQKQVVVVPTPAIQRGPNGAFVYVVGGEEERVKIRPVELTLQLETESIIKTGVQPGERIVTAGFARLQDNSRVIFARQGDAPPPATGLPGAAAPAAGGDDARARFARIREACGPDLATHCATTPRDQMRQCIEANKAKFTPTCQAAVESRPAQAGGDAKGESKGPDGKGEGRAKGEGRGKRSGDSAAPATVPPGSAAAAPAAKSAPQ